MKIFEMGIKGIVILGAGAAIADTSRPSLSNNLAEPALESRIVEGEVLYKQNCAVCHGTNLEGQKDWRTAKNDGVLAAPPHDQTGHTWHHDDELLFAYTKLGGRELMAEKGMDFDSGMPGFGDVLSDSEINAILDYIKSTWPDRVREMQAQRNTTK